MIVVSDTSPITNLAAVGYLELLQQLYGQIVIPPAVYRELTTVGNTSERLYYRVLQIVGE